MKYKIPYIDLHLSTESFFCPVTGKQLFHPEYFDPSPALVFNYYDDYNSFNEATPEIEALYKECLEELGVEGEPGDIKPFQKLVNEKLEKYNDRYLLIEMGDRFHNLFYCFDVTYNSEKKLLKQRSTIVPTSNGMDEAVFNINVKKLFCPATGLQLVNSGKFSISPSLEFIYSHTENRFELINDGLREEFSRFFTGDEGYTEMDLYQELTSQKKTFASGKHFLLTYGSLGAQTSICVDMTDSEFRPNKIFNNRETLNLKNISSR